VQALEGVMTFERPTRGKPDPWDDVAFWKRRVGNIQRALRRAEDALERLGNDVDRLADDIEMGAPVPSRGGANRDAVPLPVATEFAAVGRHRATFVVHRVQFAIETSAVRIDLLTLLAMPTRESPDELVGFKTIGTLAQMLRARGWNATRRSVTVEVSRLRAVLGPTNRHLIETRRRAGYRSRLPGTVAQAVREA
jgi:hypothetical protein